MSTGHFFAAAFREFRYATFYRKKPPQKTAGYMGVRWVMKLSILIVSILILCGCSSVAREKPSRELSSSEGYIALSTGRNRKACEDCYGNIFDILPFVYWNVLDENRESTDIVFRPQFVALGDLDDGDYGYVHARAMTSGKYTLVGASSNGFVLPCYSFSVQAGVINYLGEFLTVRGDGSLNSIEYNPKEARDMNAIYDLFPYLKSVSVVRSEIGMKKCTWSKVDEESHLTSKGTGRSNAAPVL